MLAPGFSLSKLGETVGLRTASKGIFPHDLMRQDGSFLDRPELPAKAEDWFSRLTQRAPSQEEVDEALAVFRREGFTSVREYMLHYLKADLVVLLDGLELFCKKLEETVGLHPVAVRKFSLSGFSFLAAQYQLVRDLRPGCFTCNHAAIFSSLRRAMRGGVSMVMRTVSGDAIGGSEGQAKPNGHLVLSRRRPNRLSGSDDDRQEEEEEEEEEEKGSTDAAAAAAALEESPHKLRMIYLDVASLYATSGK